jgi:tape measure domain-containing protein
MATLRELLVTIETKLNEPAMKEAQRRIDNELSKAEKKFNRVYKQVLKEQAVALKEIQDKQIRAMKSLRDNADKLGGSLRNVFIGFGAGVLVATTAIIKLNDSLNTNIARIGILSGDMSHARDRFKEILAISNETGQSVDTLSSLYGKVSMASREYNIGTKDQITLLSTIAKLAQLGGTPTSSQQGGLLQLGQAIGSATVQADEYRSIVEQLPALHVAIAKSLGKTPTQLQLWIKNAKKTGSITGKELLGAILKASEDASKGFEKLPLTFQRVQNQGVNAFIELGLAIEDKLAPVNTFINYLSTLVIRFKDYVIANKELVGLNIKQLFEGLTNSINFAIDAYKTFEPVLLWTIKNIDTLTAGLGALLAGYVALKVFMLVQMIPAAYATGVAMTAALGPVGIALVGLIALVTFLELKFKLLSNTWNNVLGEVIDPVNFKKGKEAMSKIRSSNMANPLTGGYAGNWAKNQAEAQRQGAGGNINNSQKSLSNSFYFSGMPSTAQAKSIGNNLVSSSNRAFYALN